MKVWVLFVWLTGSIPGSWTFDNKAECDEMRANYKRAVCVLVEVPKK